ncbi:hypothetical protein DM39_1492 [Burkholderia cenocepacia]|uniref:ApeA N-terminal domain-containing protein n=1 Tax=Burkholderia cenocepacia TaxID=95486 RepID=A0AAN0RQ62_9BURK|nr:hypothetical protein DM39_1492 [Burkholderia cenocepacia]
MLIDIHADFTVLGPKDVHYSGSANISIPVRDVQASVSLDLASRHCAVDITALNVEADVVSALNETATLVNQRSYPIALSSLEADVKLSAQTVVHAWKYLLARDQEIPEEALGGTTLKWKQSSSSDWHKFPSVIYGWATVRQVPHLAGEQVARLQQLVSDGVTPLVGMRYLHRAKSETDPKYRWVDATIAAELCIKEVLQKARPETEVLFTNLQSPPLHKLYGDILESFLGERSPHAGDLRRGAEIRNALVHKPAITDVDSTRASEYVKDVESAIFHALTLLFKNKGYFDFWRGLEANRY